MRKPKGSERGHAHKGNYATLSIPKELYERTKSLIEGTGFRSVTEYVVFLMRESLTMKRGESLKERLRALGYID